MKQNKLKNYLKLGILLCGVFIFLTNCQHDDLTNNDFSNHNQNKNPISLKFSNYEELEQDYKFTNALKNIKPKKGISSFNNKTVMEEQYGFNIDSTLIKQVDIGNFTSYTMYIHREAPNPDFFENLVVQVDSLNNINAYIVKYIGANTYYEAHDSYGIDADIEITPITYNASESTSSKMVYGCNEIYEVRCNGGTGGCNGGYHTPNENCYQNWNACIGLTQTGQSCGYYDDGTGGGDSSSTGDGSSGGGGGSGGSSSGDDGDGGLGDACKGCGDDGEVITAPVIDEEIENPEECENVDYELDSINNPIISNSPQFDLEFLLDNNPSPMASSEHYRNRIQATGQYFSNLSNNINNSTATTFAPIREMLADVGNNQELTLDDLIFIDTKVNEVYSILSNYNVQLETLDDLDNLYQILTPNELQTVEQNLLIAATLPTLKSMYLDFWPQNAEEWSEFGEFLLTVLQELVPELIPGVAEVIALKNAVENFNSGEYSAGAGELTLALVGIFPVGKAIKAIAKIAKGVKIVVRLSKSFRNVKKMTQAITSNSQEQALAFWKKIGCASSNNTRRVREINKATEAQGKAFYDLLTKNRVGTEIIDTSNPNGIRRLSNMPDGSTIQFRNYATSASDYNTNATIDFAGGNYNSDLIKELKFND